MRPISHVTTWLKSILSYQPIKQKGGYLQNRANFNNNKKMSKRLPRFGFYTFTIKKYQAPAKYLAACSVYYLSLVQPTGRKENEKQSEYGVTKKNSKTSVVSM